MKKVEYYYYMAYVQFENGCKSVLTLRTVDSDEELAKLCLSRWSRSFVGLSLSIVGIRRCSLRDYNKITTRITL